MRPTVFSQEAALRPQVAEIAGACFGQRAARDGFAWDALTLKSRHDLARLKPWLDLVSQPNDGDKSLFQSSGWMAATSEAIFGSGGGGEIRVLRALGPSGPVAALPLSISLAAPLRIARIAGDPLAQYADIIGDPRGWRAIAQAIESLRDVDALFLRRVRADAPLQRIVELLGGRQVARAAAPYINLAQYADFETYLRSNSKDARERRRLRRKAQTEGVVGFEVCEGSARAAELVRHALELKLRWLHSRSLYSRALHSRRWRDALVRAVEAPSSDYEPVVSALFVDATPAAIEVGFVRAGRYFAFLGAFDEAYKHISPSKLAMEDTIRWCMASGIATYDLLPPDDAYKFEWTRDHIDVRDWVIPRSVAGGLYVRFFEGYMRPLAKQLYAKTRDRLRLLRSA